MNEPRKNALQVTSDQLEGRLARIEDEVTATQSLLSHVHKDKVLDLIVEAIGGSEHRKQILRNTKEPVSVPDLQERVGATTTQNVHKHLRPLKEAGLVVHAQTSPVVLYEWGRYMRNLTKKEVEAVLK